MQKTLDYLTAYGITISLVYGECGDRGILWSVDVLTRKGESFERPFAVPSLHQAVEVARIESEKRGWLPNPRITAEEAARQITKHFGGGMAVLGD